MYAPRSYRLAPPGPLTLSYSSAFWGHCGFWWWSVGCSSFHEYCNPPTSNSTPSAHTIRYTVRSVSNSHFLLFSDSPWLRQWGMGAVRAVGAVWSMGAVRGRGGGSEGGGGDVGAVRGGGGASPAPSPWQWGLGAVGVVGAGPHQLHHPDSGWWGGGGGGSGGGGEGGPHQLHHPDRGGGGSGGGNGGWPTSSITLTLQEERSWSPRSARSLSSAFSSSVLASSRCVTITWWHEDTLITWWHEDTLITWWHEDTLITWWHEDTLITWWHGDTLIILQTYFWDVPLEMRKKRQKPTYYIEEPHI